MLHAAFRLVAPSQPNLGAVARYRLEIAAQEGRCGALVVVGAPGMFEPSAFIQPGGPVDEVFVHATTYEVHGPDWPSQAPFEPELIGSSDMEIAYGIPLWTARLTGAARRGRRRVARLDSLYGGRPVSLVVLAAGDFWAMLAGCSGLAATETAPEIVLDVASLSPDERASVLWSLHVEFGSTWTWLDRFGLHVESADALSILVQSCDESLFVLVPPARAASVWGARSLRTALAAKNRLFAQSIQQPERWFPFDDRLVCTGFHAAEIDGDVTWRWSGPYARASFAVPLADAGHWTLGLQVFGQGVMQESRQLSAQIAGRRITPVWADDNMLRLDIHPLTPADLRDGRLLVHLITPTPRRLSPGDPRFLGVCFSACILQKIG